MDRAAVLKRVADCIVWTFPSLTLDRVLSHPRVHLESELGLDSMDRFELLIELESTFAVTLDDYRFDAVKTVDGLVGLVWALVR